MQNIYCINKFQILYFSNSFFVIKNPATSDDQENWDSQISYYAFQNSFPGGILLCIQYYEFIVQNLHVANDYSTLHWTVNTYEMNTRNSIKS